jgi:hypothetical protein
MDGIIQQLITLIFTDPTKLGMVGILMLISIGSIWVMNKRDQDHKADVKELIDQAQKQNEENKKDLLVVIQKYQDGQINVIQAINEIKILLAVISAKV